MAVLKINNDIVDDRKLILQEIGQCETFSDIRILSAICRRKTRLDIRLHCDGVIVWKAGPSMMHLDRQTRKISLRWRGSAPQSLR
jgi:hypothetical protein